MYRNQFLLTTKQDERVRNYVPTKKYCYPKQTIPKLFASHKTPSRGVKRLINQRDKTESVKLMGVGHVFPS